LEHTRSIVTGFTAQAESFNTSQVATDDGLLNAILALAEPRDERWLEAACGPGLIARRLAPCVAVVDGYDLTPAMIEIARREAAAAGLANVGFAVGDATALPVPDDSFDGAVSRFSLHHIPLPGRLLAELRRVVKPGGRVVIADPLADADPDAAAWSQEIEHRPPHAAAFVVAEHGGRRTLSLQMWLARLRG
jgi:ubiquinone/menaquinone biosynthesis C-methylase UbiE